MMTERPISLSIMRTRFLLFFFFFFKQKWNKIFGSWLIARKLAAENEKFMKNGVAINKGRQNEKSITLVSIN